MSDLYTVETGQWNGMISNIVNGEVDMNTAGLTKCCKRDKVLDFFGSFSKESLGFVIKRKQVLCVSINQALGLGNVQKKADSNITYFYVRGLRRNKQKKPNKLKVS